MNFQEKMLEAANDLRSRALAMAQSALLAARSRTHTTMARAARLQATLGHGGNELGKALRRHATRFVRENATLAQAAGKDLKGIARDTYAKFGKPVAKKRASARKRPTAGRIARSRKVA